MKKTKNSYKKSGVNIETAEKFTDYIRKSSKQAFRKKLDKVNKNNIGSFSSAFDIKSDRPQIIDPTGQDNPFDKQKEIESTFSVRFFTSKSMARAALKILAPSIWSGIV